MLKEVRLLNNFINTYNINVLLYRLSKVPILGKFIKKYFL